MVVTSDSKFYSKLQLGISKYQEKTPADPLKVRIECREKMLRLKISDFDEFRGPLKMALKG